MLHLCTQNSNGRHIERSFDINLFLPEDIQIDSADDSKVAEAPTKTPPIISYKKKNKSLKDMLVRAEH